MNLVMLLEDRLVLDYPYVLQSMSSLYGIYNVAVPYLGIGNISETCDVSALGIDRMCLR
jgi:hypothetical protein